MKKVTSVLGVAAAVTAVFLLGACGGGGSDEPSGPDDTAKVQGVYGGTISGGTGNAFQMLVLEDGEYWALYGTATSTQFYVSGFLQGNGRARGGTFTSADARDFGFSPPMPGTISASYDTAARTILGSATSSSGRVSFSGGPIAGSLYDYAAAASLSTIAGSWALTSLDGAPISLNIQGSGAFTATSRGCAFSGTVVPRASGKNVFNVQLTFGAAPCALPGQSAGGIAVAYPLASGRTQLLVAAVTSDRSAGAAGIGAR